MRVRVGAVLAVVLMLVVPACGEDRGTPPAPAMERVSCGFPFEPPGEGWQARPVHEVDQGTHTGVEQVFTKGQLTLVYSAGMLRDQFETAPIREGLEMANGGEASLFAGAEGELPGAWTLFWYGEPPCKQYSVDGVAPGLREGEFLRVLSQVGVLGHDDVLLQDDASPVGSATP